ncbi:hypothetical protein NKR19_g2565 [Coniochaeta hoffmannii]|uniref:PNPLA domain-containing protein n=1 Tax=Coniochaeta hoffmannii TaxID=91930 RepID=A0AA38VZ09_9PEZI|nr:hypothetical protein NKR19_g2565 [Coniochaeta hoffmannii]
MLQLEILDMMMRRISKILALDQVAKPCEVFHLIVGSGAGGLVAVLLGRLRMSVQEVIDFYRDFEEAVFEPLREPGKIKDPDCQRAIRTAAAKQLTQLVEERDVGGYLNEAMDSYLGRREPIMGKVLITTDEGPEREERWLRSYCAPLWPRRNFKDDGVTGNDSQWTIVDAIWANMADEELFEPAGFEKRRGTFVGSLSQYDCPYQLGRNEADRLFGRGENLMGNSETAHVSIGAGIPNVVGRRDTPKERDIPTLEDFLHSWLKVSNMAHREWELESEKNKRDRERDNAYFRLDCATEPTAEDLRNLGKVVKEVAQKIKERRDGCVQYCQAQIDSMRRECGF